MQDFPFRPAYRYLPSSLSGELGMLRENIVQPMMSVEKT